MTKRRTEYDMREPGYDPKDITANWKAVALLFVAQGAIIAVVWVVF